MRAEIEWLDEALASKDVVMAMTHYRVKDRLITATNGRIVAGHPCDIDGEFLVPGLELKNIFKRLPNEPQITIKDNQVKLRSGRFSGTLQMLPPAEWVFPELDQNIKWEPFPPELMPIIRDLRPFVSDNAAHRWSLGLSIDNGWCFASDNTVLAGATFASGKKLRALVPQWVLDFLLQRFEGLQQWAISDTFMAFRWRNGAWMRSTLIDDQFPERAKEMIQKVKVGPQKITPDYKIAVTRICELTDKEFPVNVHADKVEGRTRLTVVSEKIKSAIPDKAPHSMWSASSLALVMGVATSWDPASWPRSSFHGERVRGVIAGRA